MAQGDLGPGSLGDAYITIHGDTTPVEKDLEQGLDKAGRDSEKDADKVGKDLGSHIGDGIEKEVSKKGPDIAKSLGKAIEKEAVDIRPNFRYNTRGSDGRFVSRVAGDLRDDIEAAFADDGQGGIFKNLRLGFADALGALFNVSGRSPLIGALVPVFGSLVGVIGAAIQAANSLVAVLTVIPALIGAIGLQAGVLFLAFRGVGESIKGAFAATNAKELNEAIKGLTPTAQSFVKSLLTLRPLFKDLTWLAQENFFRGLGNAVTRVATFLAPFLKKSTIDLAMALGYAFNYIAQAFVSPQLAHFLQRLIPATAKWLAAFGPSFATFLVGLIKVADTTIPFLTKLGELVNGALLKFGNAFLDENALAGFADWLNSMYKTLLLLGPLIGSALAFIVSFLQSLDRAGGNRLIETLTTILNRFAMLFASEIGFQALKAVIDIAIASMYVLTFAVFGILAVLALLKVAIDWLVNTGFPGLISILWGFVAAFSDGIKSIGSFFASVYRGIVDFFANVKKGVTDWVNNLIPSLFNAGKQVLQSLVDGMKAKVSVLTGFLSYVTALIPKFKGPEDKDKKLLRPAGEAIMTGLGAGISAGANDVMKQLEGFTNGIGGIGISNNSNPISFGANAVQVNFNGSLPSSEQAMATGQAVGSGINRILAARNTRLAVRSL